MSILNWISIKLTCEKKGCDQFGNSYYQSSGKNYLGRQKRYVIYAKDEEPSMVPPLFHSWLHHLTNDFPLLEKINLYHWQIPYIHNQTGTKNNSHFDMHNRKIVSSDYQPWKPK